LFYPFLEIEKFEGFTNIFNYPPNNWELKNKFIHDKYLNLSWIENNSWRTKNIIKLKKNSRFQVNKKKIEEITNTQNFKVLSLTNHLVNERHHNLPYIKDENLTKTPNWRASIGIKLGNIKTSYQGEIYPFPEKGGILSLCPFLQF
jgi:hypothetical protein